MRVLTWTASERIYAIDTHRVVEVVPMVEVRPLDHVQDWIRGLMNFRGRLIPLLDAKALLGGPIVEPRRSSRIIVAQLVADDRSSLLGLLVEKVGNVQELEFSGDTSHPGLANPQTEHLGPLALVEGQAIQLLDPQKILDGEQRELLFGRAQGVEA